MNDDESMPHAQMPRPDVRCAWCDIRATAVPDIPPILWEGRWYHRLVCYPVARLKAGGYLPKDYPPVHKMPEWTTPAAEVPA